MCYGNDRRAENDSIAWDDRELDRLLRAARRGDRKSLGDVLEKYEPFLLLLAAPQIDDSLAAKGGASDLVQETFLEAQRDFPTFDGKTQGEFRAWLASILKHNAADFRRRFRGADKRDVQRETRLKVTQSGTDLGHQIPDDTDSPSGIAIARERNYDLDGAVRRLPADYARVIELRHQNNLTFAEIGEQLGLSDEAARKLWCRAIQRLKKDLNPRDA
jgi:RNA polymerase sigma-70 factor (ECF subfamily)